MDQTRKDNLSKKMTLKWKQAEKFSEILKRPKNEVYNNLDLCLKYSKQLKGMAPYYIDLVLREGKWSQPYNGEVMQTHREVIQESKENYENQKAECIGYQLIEKKEENPMEGLNLAFWFIKKIGSVEKAEKLFQAAKLAIEASK